LERLAERRRSSSCLVDWVCHATYLINLASTDAAVCRRSAECLAENLRVSSALGASALIVHVGSHMGVGLVGRLAAVCDAIGAALEATPAGSALLLENTAGAGGTIGRTFEELAVVMDGAGWHERLGVCLDSQHLWASGYDFSTPSGMSAVVDELADAVGLERLRCLHLNDSKVPLGAQRDRHANLGEGFIGDGGLAAFLGHPAVQGLPAVMEFEGYGGDGAEKADLDAARLLHASGLELYG
jgi:deoxyribonuclease IV